MSRLAAPAAVRVAARTLPFGVRERYREEWLADLQGAREAGVRASAIAVGALLFSATLRRDSPDVLGMPLGIAAQRRARWAAALLLSAVVLVVGMYLMGGYGTRGMIVAVVWGALGAGAALGGIVALWGAAVLSSPLAKIAAAMITTAVLTFSSLAVIPRAAEMGATLMPAGIVLALVGASIGAVVWLGTTGPGLPPLSPRPRMPAAMIAALVLSGVLCVALIAVVSGLSILLAGAVLPVAALVAGATYVLRARRSAHQPAPRGAWLTVFAAGALILTTLLIGALDLLVWSPLTQAPSYTLDEIWAALSPLDRTQGIASAAVWVVFWTVAAVVYLAGCVAGLGRAERPALRSVAGTGLFIVAGAVFFQFVASFGIGMSIADTLPPYTGAGSGVRGWYAMLGQLSLVAALLLIVAPRPLRKPEPAIV